MLRANPVRSRGGGMRTASSVPFHLRPNKHVDRRLFIELLAFVDKASRLEDGAYISMGGRALEDHRLVHRRFGTTRLLSIDSDEWMVERQSFNRPYPFIECRHMASRELVSSFEAVAGSLGSPGPFVIWLDYTDADRNQQLRETMDIVSRLTSSDVLRVTMNASPHTLSRTPFDQSTGDTLEDAAAELQAQLGEFAEDEKVEPVHINQKGMAREISLAIRNAALKGLEGSPHLTARPLACFRYNDSMHQMLTVTFAIVTDDDWQRLAAAGVEEWDFYPRSWEDVTLIDVPDLSVKEQLHVAQFIGEPKTDELLDRMEFRLGGGPADQRKQLEEYERHYRRYPTFVPTSL